jgi:hypothetical protein
MKKLLTLLSVIVVIGLVCIFIYPYKVQRVCFGDLCPQNGGVYLLYRNDFTKEQCLAKGSYPVEGIGWVAVYAGCSPIQGKLSR